MWPWGHLAVGYLVYAGLAKWRFDRPPGDLETVILILATQIPDLIDKPLAWTVPVLPNGRSLGHSAFIALALIGLIGWAAKRHGRHDLGWAFGIGYVSHLLTDGLGPFLAGRWAELAFLVWPVLPPVEYSGPKSIVERFAVLAGELAVGDISGMLAFQFLLVVLAGVLWTHHECPGLKLLNDWFVSITG